MFEKLPINTILDAVVETFNASNTRNDLSGLLTREKLSNAHGILASRPFSQYRDICALLIKKYGDIDDAGFQTLLLSNNALGIPHTADAAARAERHLKQGNAIYAIPYDKLIMRLLPPELRAMSRAQSFVVANTVVDKPIDLSAHRNVPKVKPAAAPAPAPVPEFATPPTAATSHLTPSPPPNAPNTAQPPRAVFINRKGHISIDTDRHRRINIKNNDAQPGRTAPAVPAPMPATGEKLAKLPLTLDNVRLSCVEAWNKVVLSARTNTKARPVTQAMIDASKKDVSVVTPRRVSMYACHRLLNGTEGTLHSVAKSHGDRGEKYATDAFYIVAGHMRKGNEKEIARMLEYVADRLDLTATAAVALMNPDIVNSSQKSPTPVPAPSNLPWTKESISRAAMWSWNSTFPQQSISSLDMFSSTVRSNALLPRQIAAYVEQVLKGPNGQSQKDAQEIGDKVRDGDKVVIDILKRMVGHLNCNEVTARALMNPGVSATPAKAEPPQEKVTEYTYVKKPVTIHNIINATISAWNGDLYENGRLRDKNGSARVTRDLIISASRADAIILPRQISMYTCLVMKEGKRSAKIIGDEHGGRDHTTVLHAYRKIADLLIAKDEKVARIVGKVLDQLDGSDVMARMVLNPPTEGRVRRRPGSESPKAP